MANSNEIVLTATINQRGERKVSLSKQIVSFREAFGFWLKLGFISFGVPAGQIAIMHK